MTDVLISVRLLFPLFAFAVAAIIEVRSALRPAENLRSLAPIALGVLVYALFWGPALNPRFVYSGMRWLTLCSAAVAASGAVIPYSRKLSSFLVLLGGLELVRFPVLPGLSIAQR